MNSLNKNRVISLVVFLTCTVSPLLANTDIDFSPDGKQISFSSVAGLNAIFAEGGVVRPLGGGQGGTWSHWAPDGRSILFAVGVNGRSTLKVYNADKNTSSAIGADMDRPTAWREDGRKFAATHIKPDNHAEIIQYSLLDSGISLRTDVDVMPSGDQMVWLPSSDDVAYLGVDGNIYTVEAGEAHKITTSYDVLGLALSADGKSLIWARHGPNLKYILFSVYSYDLQQRSAVRIPYAERFDTINPNTKIAPNTIEKVIFSSDANHALVFVTVADSKDANTTWNEVHLVKSDGTGGKLIARMKGNASPSAAFSKDGKMLAVHMGSVLKSMSVATGQIKIIAH